MEWYAVGSIAAGIVPNTVKTELLSRQLTTLASLTSIISNGEYSEKYVRLDFC